MKIVHAGIITTVIVISLGLLMVVPSFILPAKPQTVLLSFSIVDEHNTPQWCNELSSVLKKYNVKAIVFVTGKIAEQYPECVSTFPDNVDIGSQTYNYENLVSIDDYTARLDEIKNGKRAIYYAGNIDSRIFKAPYGSTDNEIYSLLSRSGIIADFSYTDQYNKYYDNKFIKFEINSYDGKSHSADFFRGLPVTGKPVFINFDNSTPASQIDDLLSKLKSKQINFVSASDLTGFDLTIRGIEKA